MTPRKLFHFPKLIHEPTNYLHYSTTRRSSTTVFKKPFLPKPPSILATNVINSYFETGLVEQARKLFDEMPDRDVVAWSAMIGGYASSNFYTAAAETFRDMLRYGGADVKPNAFTFSSTLKACKNMGSLVCGESVHGLAVKHGVVGNVYVDNALMDVYSSCCDDMEKACAMFEQIIVKNSVSWTTLIAGYTHLGDAEGALRVFRQMLLDDEAELNPFSISIAVKACASVGLNTCGKQIHAMVIKHGFESSIPVMNSILDMCFRCIGLNEADKCFHEMEERDIITWNTYIAGYEKSDPYEAINLYSRLESEGLTPNCFTFTTVIAAVANIAVLGFGIQIHGTILKRGLQDNLGVANALIDMYAKCGSIKNSCMVFDEMPFKNVISWSTMMVGHGSHGRGKETVELFNKMVQSGVKPDRIVFLAVLNACSHTGLIDEGLKYFKSMIGDYDISPDREVYGCVVDLLGRAGRVREAYELIESMPFMPDETVWGAFLGACKAHKLAELGKLAGRKVLDLRPSVAGTYLALSNIYAFDGKWGDFAQIRKLLRGTGNKKEAGKSWIEVKNQVLSFVSGDKMGSHIECVYSAVHTLGLHMKHSGYNPDLQDSMHDLEDGGT